MPADSHEAEPGRVIDPGVLAERRARRAELAESGLLERAERAERAAQALERRLADTVTELARARDERERSFATLQQTERELTAALQREFAEQALRVEAEGEAGADRRRLEAEVDHLRLVHREAEGQVAELSSALAHARREVAVAQASALAEAERALGRAGASEAGRPPGPHDTLAPGLGARDASASRPGAAARGAFADPVPSEVPTSDESAGAPALRGQDDAAEARAAAERERAEELARSLEAEQAARSAAEHALAIERDRAAAEVTLLQHELDRGRTVHAAVTEQVSQLRGELVRVRTRHGADDERAEDARRTFGEVAASTDQLRSALAGLEQEREHTRAEIAEREQAHDEARHALREAERRVATRDAELAALREELARRGEAVGRAQAAGSRDRAALAAAEQGTAAAGAQMAEAEARVAAAQGAVDELKAAGVREREQFAATLARAETEHRAALERAAIEAKGRARAEARTTEALREQLAAVEEQLGGLRGSAAGSGEARGRITALEEELAAEQTRRQAVAARAEQQAAAAQEQLSAFESQLARQASALAGGEESAARIDRLAARLRTLEAALQETERQLAEATERVETAETEREVARGLADGERARADAADQARELLITELAERAALEDQVRAALGSLRDQLEQERGRHAGREEQDAAVEALVAELVTTSERLRAGFEAELASVQVVHEEQLQAERRAFAAELGGTEQRVGELREQLVGVADRLQAELERERTARWVAEEELARERDARAAGLPVLEDDDGSERPVYDRLPTGARVPPSDHPALRTVEAPEPEGAIVLDIARAAERLRELRPHVPTLTSAPPIPDEAAPDQVAELPAPSSPDDPSGATMLLDDPVGEPVEPASVDDAFAEPPLDDPADAPASHQARDGSPDAGDHEDPDADQPQHTVPAAPFGAIASAQDDALAVPPASDDSVLLARGDAPAGPPASDATVLPSEHDAPAAIADDADPTEALGGSVRAEGLDEPAGLPAEAEALGLEPDVVTALVQAPAGTRRARRAAEHELTRLEAPRPAAPTTWPWLGEALTRLADAAPAAAERVLLACLDLQAAAADRELVYALQLPTGGMRRVAIVPGARASVTEVQTGPADAELLVSGPLGALAGLVTGGGRRRLPGVRVKGRKRGLRRLLKAMPRPVGLPEMAAAGVAVAPGDLLRLLCAAATPVETGAEPVAVAYVVGTEDSGPDPIHLVLAESDGRLWVQDGPSGGAAATVRIARSELALLLAGQAEARVAGDVDAVRRVHAALLRPQGR